MIVSVIAAVSAYNNAIGRDGTQPFMLGDDLQRFKKLTSFHPIIMGRKTFEALPKGALPNRTNIVVTRNPDYKAPGALVVNSLEEAISTAEHCSGNNEAFIIGGAQIYKEALEKRLVTMLRLTLVDVVVPDADAYFPNVTPSDWICLSRTEPAVDSKSGIEYTYMDLAPRH